MAVFAKAGERIMDAVTGQVICHVAADLEVHSAVRADQFSDFSEGEPKWLPNMPLDPRCTRNRPDDFGIQLYVEGEWRP